VLKSAFPARRPQKHRRTSLPPPSIDEIARSLKELAVHCKDREAFLDLAKEAWDRVHYREVPKRGRKSVADQCFEAIWNGYVALPDGIRTETAGEYSVDSYAPIPQGRLVQMIRDRFPNTGKPTAIKYARIWERENQTVNLTGQGTDGPLQEDEGSSPYSL
jgi:hypothetical protein